MIKSIFSSLVSVLSICSISFAEGESSSKLPDTLANIEAEPSSFAHGCVNVITGDYTENECDIVIPGVDPLVLNRFYTSGNSTFSRTPSTGWCFNHHGYLSMDIIEQTDTVSRYSYDFCNHHGSFIQFKEQEQHGALKVNKSLFDKGITNCGGGEISARSNLKNTKVFRQANDIRAVDGAGTDYTFTPFKTCYKTRKIQEIKLPSQSRFSYSYTQKGDDLLLKKIRMINCCGSEISWIDFERKKNDLGWLRLKTNDGREILYNHYSKTKQSPQRLDITSNFAIPKTYIYSAIPVKLIGKQLPHDRSKEIQYYKKGTEKNGNETIKIKAAEGRVKLIKEPVGHDPKMITTARFIYQFEKDQQPHLPKGNGTTTYYDALNHKTEYGYNVEERLTSISTFKGTENHVLLSKEHLYWGSREGQDHTNLKGWSMHEADGSAVFCRRFKYDARGNILSDSVYGNLQGGHVKPLVLDNHGHPQENGCDQFKINYTYSEDGRNLVTSETHDTHQVVYRYDQQRGLLLAKFITSEGIRKRYFYNYDVNGAVTLEVIDDGNTDNFNNLSGVTERRSRRITNTFQLPSGLPEEISEYYLDPNTRQEVFLSKVVYRYDRLGHPLRHEHYGSDGHLAYTLLWEYDGRGNVIKSTDPLGQVTERRYDENDNLVLEQGPNLDAHHVYAYDFMNRLIRKETICADGQRFAETFRYDFLGNTICSTDIYGNETFYEYDSQRHIKATHLPRFSGQEKQATIHQKYDLQGNIIALTNGKGETTHKKYTIRGKPYVIHYPDGTQEQHCYFENGNLKQSIAKNGTVTTYAYDYLSRPIETKIYNSSGALVAVSTSAYNAWHLLSQTDAMGNRTYYHYDGAGRLSKVEKNGTCIEYLYDTLGRETETREHTGNGHYIAKSKQHDNLNRVLSEQTSDEKGNVFTRIEYVYDAEGNRTQTFIHNQAGTTATTIRYNVFREPLEVMDTLGNRLITVHHYHLGVACSETTDPLGNITITTKDPAGQVACIERKNPFGKTAQKKDYFYDHAGHIEQLVETVIAPNQPDQHSAIHWEYNGAGQLEVLTEAAGTPLQKTTRYTYNRHGQKERDIKPDGVSLIYSYDHFGRVSERISSEGSIHDKFIYDLNHRLIEIQDLTTSQTATKRYDRNGNLVEEVLENGLSLSSAYDGLGRTVLVTLPDASKIAYDYDPYHLKEITRLDAADHKLYSHIYTNFDQSGCATQAQMIGAAGIMQWTYDPLGRVHQINTPTELEIDLKYDAIGNLTERSFSHPSGEIDIKRYTYDDLYQLQSEQGPVSHTYTYDSKYNRLEKDGGAHDVNRLDQLLTDGYWQFSYDHNGRLKSKQHDDEIFTFDYDALDRLITLTHGTTQHRYNYDAENRRLTKKQYCRSHDDAEWTLETDTRFLYQGQNEIGAVNASGTLDELRVLGIGKGAEIGAAVAIELKGHAYAPVHDHQGSVISLIDSQTGQTTHVYHYSAFGEEEIVKQNDLNNPWRFSSKRLDPESGFTFFGRRYYDSTIGRWTTPDPIGFDGGPNLYAYVLNNPLTHFDLYGLAEAVAAAEAERQTDTANIVVRIVRKAGEIIRAIGDHFLPIPFVRDAISYVGHRMAGGSHDNFQRICRNPYSYNGTCGNKEISRLARLLYVNGMVNTDQTCIDTSKHISETHGDTMVHYTYNSSHGFMLDLFECLAQKLGFRTHSVDRLVDNIKQNIQSMGGVKSGGTVRIYASSQGGLILNNALKYLSASELAMIEIMTFGSAKQIDDERLKMAHNYVNTQDYVPFVSDPIGCIRGIYGKNGNTTVLQSKNSAILDHELLKSQNYCQVIENEGTKFQNKYH